jgi:hypothetical protein
MENNITLRDRIAIESMKATCNWWYTIKLDDKMAAIKGWVNRYGNISVNDCIAKDSYALADAMLKAREL